MSYAYLFKYIIIGDTGKYGCNNVDYETRRKIC